MKRRRAWKKTRPTWWACNITGTRDKAQNGTRDVQKFYRKKFPRNSEKRTHWILAVPADGGAVEAAEDGIEGLTEFNQFDHAGKMRSGVHVGDAAAAGDASEKSLFVATITVECEIAVKMRRGDAPMVK